MTPQALIERAQAEGVKLMVRDGTRLVADPINRLSPELRELLRAHKPEIMALLDPQAEARRQRVLALLSADPKARYAVLTDTEADPEGVLLTLAIRDRATCELRIPREKWDGVLFLDLLERHGGMVH